MAVPDMGRAKEFYEGTYRFEIKVGYLIAES
jgi:hypothetical protein